MLLEGSVWNFSISVHVSITAKAPLPAEAHTLTTTTTTEGKSLSEAWNKAMENGLLDNLPSDALEHFKKLMRSILKRNVF